MLLTSAYAAVQDAGGVAVEDGSEHIVQLRRALGRRLADLRRATQVTQQDLAQRTFVDRTYVSHAERGLHVPQRSFWVAADVYLGADGALCKAYDELISAQHAIKQAELDALRARHLQQGNAVDHHAEALLCELVGVLGPAAAGRPYVSSDGQLPLTAAHTVHVMESFTGHDLINRRHVLQQLSILSGSALLRPVQQWIGLLPVEPPAVDAGVAELGELERAVRLFRRWDAAGIGGLKRKAVIGQLNAVAEIVREASNSSARQRLFQVIAELAQLVGWMSYDQGLKGAAQRYYVLALHACREAGARSLAAKILSDMMKLSTSLGHYKDSLDLARAGLYVLPSHDNASVRAELLGCEARAYAHIGTEHAETIRSVEACLSVWQALTDEQLPDWLHYMDQASGSEVDCLAANAYTQLALATPDKPRWQNFADRAQQHVMNARLARSNQYRRSGIIDELRLARLRLAQREPVEAANVAARALTTADQVDSSIVNDWLIRFNSDLADRYPKLPQAGELTTQLRDYFKHSSPERARELQSP